MSIKNSAMLTFIGIWILSGCVQTEEKPKKAANATEVVEPIFDKTDEAKKEEEVEKEVLSTFVIDTDKVFLDKATSDEKEIIKECAEALGSKSTATVAWPKTLKVFLTKELNRPTQMQVLYS